MASDYFGVFMVKSMCSNIKMEFDLTKANLLESQEAMQLLYNFLKKVEKLEKENTNELMSVEDLNEIKQAITRAKENMKNLQSKLTKHTHKSKQVCLKGLKLLEDRLQRTKENLVFLVDEKQKLVVSCSRYKQLRGKQTKKFSPYSSTDVNRNNKLKHLKQAIEDSDNAISSANVEKGVLEEACDKMKIFLDDTQSILKQMYKLKRTPTKEGNATLNWCSSVLNSVANLSMFKEHSIDDNKVAFELINLPSLPSSTPRLIIIVTFTKLNHLLHPYGIIHVSSNIDSLNIGQIVDVAIFRNDLSYLLQKIDFLWEKHVVVLSEVVSLRRRFPIDWLGEEHKLRILLGPKKNTVFTLNIPVEYPVGKITLEKIEGSVDKQICDFKPNGSNPTLVDWVEYLDSVSGEE